MHKEPLFLSPMRVERTYTGGKLLDEWQGRVPGKDSLMPESWIASTLTARYAADPATGLSIIRDGRLKGRTLRDYICGDPETILGKEHYENLGDNPGFLAKIIDSDNRLNIQTHPDRAQAKRLFDSDFGKTEAWYVMNTRTIRGESPYILLGFKPGITREEWVKAVERQDIETLEASLHKIPVKKSDVFLIPSGMPHAIGSGCMIAEIQEPTDITFRVEKIEHEGRTYSEDNYHQGIGYEKMFDCFNYEGYLYDDLLGRVRLNYASLTDSLGNSVQPLVKTVDTAFFSMEKVMVSDKWQPGARDSFCVIIVLSGKGRLHSESVISDLAAGDELFIPCGVECLFSSDQKDSGMEILICYPPGVIL